MIRSIGSSLALCLMIVATTRAEIYELPVIVAPTNEPIRRQDYDDLIYKTRREKFAAVLEEIEALDEMVRRIVEERERLLAGQKVLLVYTSANRDSDAFDDPDTFRLLSAGNTVGVFQLESSGMRDLLRRLATGHLRDHVMAFLARRVVALAGDLVARRSQAGFDVELSQEMLSEIDKIQNLQPNPAP